MRSTGTNYLPELHYTKTERIPLRPEPDIVSNGPWQRNNSLPLPPVVLTKTHCAGYKDRTSYKDSIISTAGFLEGCATSIQFADYNNLKNRLKVRTKYDHKNLVVSVVHLIRNPFDNIISRMHHGMKIRQQELGLSDEVMQKMMSTPAGVMAWCKVSDNAFRLENQLPKRNAKDKNFPGKKTWDLRLLLNIPCHSEIFRYVEWHNAAIRMIQQEKFRSLVVYYENYETKYNQTVDSVLEFLGLTREAEPLPFRTGKTYRDHFFTQNFQDRTKEAIQGMASDELWQILRKYFPSGSSTTDEK